MSPVHQAEEIVDELVARIVEEVSSFTDAFEIILVEDGSSDNSWGRIEENCRRDKRVKGIKFSRNFGQHRAIAAGLAHAQGDYVVVMDCDLQDDPVYIRPMVELAARDGFDIVYTIKRQRKHRSFLKNVAASLFNKALGLLAGDSRLAGDTRIGAFSCLSRNVVEQFNRVTDYHRHYLLILRWLGFKHTYLEIEHRERAHGGSSYTLTRLLEHAIDGITSQTDKLLTLSLITGFAISAAAFLGIIAIVALYLTVGFLAGWASLSVLILFSTGVVVSTLGIVGIYVGKTFEQSKARPLYIVEKILGDGLGCAG